MIPTDLPTDAVGLTAFLAILVYLAWTNRRNRRAHNEHGVVLEEVREQVSNDNSSNLRDDVDRVDAKVESVDSKVDRLTGTVDALQRSLDMFMAESRDVHQALINAKHHGSA